MKKVFRSYPQARTDIHAGIFFWSIYRTYLTIHTVNKTIEMESEILETNDSETPPEIKKSVGKLLEKKSNGFVFEFDYDHAKERYHSIEVENHLLCEVYRKWSTGEDSRYSIIFERIE